MTDEKKEWLVVEWMMEVKEDEDLHLAELNGYEFLLLNKDRLTFTDAAEFNNESPDDIGHALVAYLTDNFDKINYYDFRKIHVCQEAKSITKKGDAVVNIAYPTGGHDMMGCIIGYSTVEKKNFIDIFTEKRARLREVSNAINSRKQNSQRPYGLYVRINQQFKTIGVTHAGESFGLDEICIILNEIIQMDKTFPSLINNSIEGPNPDNFSDDTLKGAVMEMIYSPQPENQKETFGDDVLRWLRQNITTSTPTIETIPATQFHYHRRQGIKTAPTIETIPAPEAAPPTTPMSVTPTESSEPTPMSNTPTEQVVLTKTGQGDTTKWKTLKEIQSLIGIHLEEVKGKNPSKFWLPITELTKHGYKRTTLASERKAGSTYTIGSYMVGDCAAGVWARYTEKPNAPTYFIRKDCAYRV